MGHFSWDRRNPDPCRPRKGKEHFAQDSAPRWSGNIGTSRRGVWPDIDRTVRDSKTEHPPDAAVTLVIVEVVDQVCIRRTVF